MKRSTKIIATIGPTCESDEMVKTMIETGVNVFRYNFKHNSVDWHAQLINHVNDIARKMGSPVGALLDLQGPEIRTDMVMEEISLVPGDKLLLTEKITDSTEKAITITHPNIIDYIEEGQRIVINDGQFEFTAKREKGKTWLLCHSKGILKPRKTMNIPGADFPFPVLTERDYDGLILAKKANVDYIALSFVRSASDVEFLKKEMTKRKIEAKVVSKIETQKAIDDLDAIIDASDGLMVARGDLGVELPFEQVPFYQKLMIKKCIEKGKFAITATQMLETMIKNPMPTRAEVSDIANATYDKSDAVMLSQESAFGDYPQKSVEVMRKTIEYNETKFIDDSRKRFKYQLAGSAGMIAESAYDLYIESFKKIDTQNAQAFLCFTHTGKTAQLISAFRPHVPIFAICPEPHIATKLSLSYGVHAIVNEKKFKKSSLVSQNDILSAVKDLLAKKLIKKGLNVIVTHGDLWSVEGGSSTIRLLKP